MSALDAISTGLLESTLLVYNDCRIGGLALAAALQGIETELANRRAATETAFRFDSEVACLREQLANKEEEISELHIEIGSLKEQMALLKKELKTAKTR
jgi:uncharacterized protein involved in exopolysaccharide biosynthesis